MDDLADCGPDPVAVQHFRTFGLSPAFAGIWAEREEIWPATTFPTGRGQRRQVSGWMCPGCGRGFSPDVRECPYYPEHPKAGPHGRAEAPIMGEWDDDE